MIILYDCLGRFKMTQHVCLHLNASGELDLSHISGSHDHDDDQKGFSNFGQRNSGHGEFPL